MHDNMDVLFAIGGSRVKEPPWNNLMKLTSLAGQQFLSFGKYVGYAQGLFRSCSDFVDLFVLS